MPLRTLRRIAGSLLTLSLSLFAADKSRTKTPAASEPSYDQPQPARENLDLNMYQQIRLEGLNHSHIMEFASRSMTTSARASPAPRI